MHNFKNLCLYTHNTFTPFTLFKLPTNGEISWLSTIYLKILLEVINKIHVLRHDENIIQL